MRVKITKERKDSLVQKLEEESSDTRENDIFIFYSKSNGEKRIQVKLNLKVLHLID